MQAGDRTRVARSPRDPRPGMAPPVPQAILDALDVHVAVLDEAGTIVAVNAAWRRFAAANGYDKRECGDAEYGLGEDYLAICDAATGTDAADASAAATAIREILSGSRTSFVREYACHGPDEQRWFALRATSLAADGGTFVVLAHTNITAQRRAEEARHLQAHLLDRVEAAVIATDAAHAITYWNAHATTLYGWSPDEVLGRDIGEVLVGPGERAAARAVAGRIQNGESWSGEFPARRKDGLPVPVQATSSPLHDLDGALVGAVGVSVGIAARKRAEEALRASERKYRTLVERAADGIALIDHDGVLVEVNPAALALLDYARDELVGLPLANLVSPRESFDVPAIVDAMRAGIVIQRQRSLRHRDGTWRVVDMSAAPLDDGLILGIWRDVTAEQATAAALRESEARFRLLAENAQDLIFRYRLRPTPGFDYISPAATQLLGYAPEEFYAEAALMFGLVHPDDRDHLAALYAAHDVVDRRPIRWIRKDGTTVWTEQRLRPILDGDGQLVAVEGIARDVTARVAAEVALRDSEAHARAIVDTAVDAIVTIDERGAILSFNSAAERLFGYAAAEAIGRSAEMLMRPHDAEAHRAALARYRATGQRRVLGLGRQVTGRRKDGGTFPLNLAVSEVRLSGRRIYTGIMHDMTERVRLLEQERAARAAAEAAQRRLQLLADLTEITGRDHADLGALLGEVARLLGATVGDGCAIRLFDADAGRFAVQAAYHPDPVAEAAIRDLSIAAAWWRENPIARALRGGEAVRFARVDDDNLLPPGARSAYERIQAHAALIAPLRGRSGFLGGISLMRDRTPVPFDDGDQSLVQEVADRLVLAVENAHHRQHEAALREEEERFRSLYAMAGQVTISLDGRILSANRAVREMSGYDEAELLGVPTLELTHPDDRAATADRLRRLLEGEFPYYHHEKRFLRKDGGTLHALTSTGLIRDGDGTPRYLIAMLQDISERKRAEVALAESEWRHRAVVAALDEGVVLRWADWTVGTANANAARLLGLTPEQATGEAPPPPGWCTIREDGTPFPVEEWPARVALRTGRPLSNVTLGVRHPDGRLTWLSVNAQPLYRDGETIPYAEVTSFFDITQRRRAEADLRAATAEAERANRAKSEFLSRMSHELRTPLNAILGFAQLLEMDGDSLDARQRLGVGHILKGGKHLLALINEVLDLAQIESGRLTLSPEPVELCEILAECLDLIRPLAERRAVAIDDRIAPHDALVVLADRQRLKQVLLNLLSNAIKYNRDGGAILIERAVAATDRVRLMVRDTGRGIPTPQLARLFQPFERLGAEGGQIEGTGLGLAVARQLIESMGGAIGLERTGPQGSDFWIDLPATSERASEPEASRPVPATASGARIVGRTILVIEDNPANLALIERFLAQRPDLETLAAASGEAGLALARAHHPDLILLDQQLPGMAGDAVLRTLRAHPATSTIPIVMVSADATPRQIERLMDEGAVAYLAKPIDVGAVLATVDRLLGKGEGP